MTELVNIILNSMSTLNKPQRLFMASLFTIRVLFQGKSTFRNMSCYSSVNEKQFSRWYRRKFPYATFNTQLLTHSFTKPYDCIAVIDAGFIKKSGKQTDGLTWFYNGAQGAAERGLEVPLISAAYDITSSLFDQCASDACS